MRKIDFNQDWLFYKEDSPKREKVSLPHDAMLREQRHPDAESGEAGAYFPGGIYHYEKIVYVPEEWENQHLVLEFEGVYRNAEVCINGEMIAGRPYGYSNFFVEMDDWLCYGQENRIHVIADNSKVPNSRWYSGGGIYRPVQLYVGGKKYIKPEGIKITTISVNPPRVRIETDHTGGDVEVEIRFQDQYVASGKGDNIELLILDAMLWSDETPDLYQCHVKLYENGVLVDEAIESFGIRSLEWSTKGLFINGKETLLRGGCVHHDNGILGACAYPEAEERRVRIMKETGYNAIRSAHNPMSKAMLDACDKYGIYVMDESFDQWYFHKNRYDYACDFEKWHEADLKSMVDKDKNHPSVIMYSIGNEVSEPYEAKGVDVAKEMVNWLHQLDATRPVTAGINLMLMHWAKMGIGLYKGEEKKGRKKPGKKKKQKQSGSAFYNMIMQFVGTGMSKLANRKSVDRTTTPGFDVLDIAGYNYASGRYPHEGKIHSDRIVVGSETFPADLADNWRMVKKYPYLIGDFMWTAWDYLGEVGLGGWFYSDSQIPAKAYPWLLADSGAIDILGHIGAEGKYASVVWGKETKPCIFVKPANHPKEKIFRAAWRGTNAVDSWSWKNCTGNHTEVEVYSDAAYVELKMNGISCGRKVVKGYKAIFKVVYQPGILTAIAYDEKEREISRSELKSAKKEIGIRIISEKNANSKEGNLIFVNIILADRDGIVESNADCKLKVSVEGGELLAFGSANPCTAENYLLGEFTTYYGRSMAVVQKRHEKVVVNVTGDNIEAVSEIL